MASISGNAPRAGCTTGIPDASDSAMYMPKASPLRTGTEITEVLAKNAFLPLLQNLYENPRGKQAVFIQFLSDLFQVGCVITRLATCDNESDIIISLLLFQQYKGINQYIKAIFMAHPGNIANCTRLFPLSSCIDNRMD